MHFTSVLAAKLSCDSKVYEITLTIRVDLDKSALLTRSYGGYKIGLSLEEVEMVVFQRRSVYMMFLYLKFGYLFTNFSQTISGLVFIIKFYFCF